ncbi:MAG: hypothetical protein QXL17_02935 [Candidatus Thermoplasmatota archaeon]
MNAKILDLNAFRIRKQEEKTAKEAEIDHKIKELDSLMEKRRQSDIFKKIDEEVEYNRKRLQDAAHLLRELGNKTKRCPTCTATLAPIDKDKYFCFSCVAQVNVLITED